MGTAWVECWKCDECGHRWIKGEIWPTHCASSKCRKRSWNKNAGAGIDETPATSAATVGTNVKSPAVALEPQQAPFKMNDAMAKFMQIAGPVVADTQEAEARQPCPHKEWAEDGEQYRCRLLAGHKGKCQPGERIS